MDIEWTEAGFDRWVRRMRSETGPGPGMGAVWAATIERDEAGRIEGFHLEVGCGDAEWRIAILEAVDC